MKRSIISFLGLFFIFVLAALAGEPASAELGRISPGISEISDVTAFHIVPLEKIANSPVQWVTAGGGVLAYGSGKEIYFAFEENPRQIVSSLSFDQNVPEVLILGRYAFVGQEDSGIRLIDLSDPSEPIDLGLYTLPVSTSHLASWGNLLLVGNGGPVVRLFEISEGEGKGGVYVFLDRGSITADTPVTAITVSAAGKVYIATEGELKVYDLSDPLNPAEVDSFPLNVPINSMSVNGDVLFAAGGTEGLQVFDLSTPGTMATLATYEAPSESLYVAGRRVYLAGGADGLQLLEAGPTAPATFVVQVGNFGFVPQTITINTGDSVRWIGQGLGSSVVNIEGPPPPTPLPSEGEGKGEGGPSGTFRILSANGSSATRIEPQLSEKKLPN